MAFPDTTPSGVLSDAQKGAFKQSNDLGHLPDQGASAEGVGSLEKKAQMYSMRHSTKGLGSHESCGSEGEADDEHRQSNREKEVLKCQNCISSRTLGTNAISRGVIFMTFPILRIRLWLQGGNTRSSIQLIQNGSKSTTLSARKKLGKEESGNMPPQPPPQSVMDKWDDLRNRLSEIQAPDPEHPWNIREAGKAIGNIGAGGLGVILHPLNTLAGIGGTVTAPFEMMAGTPFSKTVPGMAVRAFKSNPLGTIEGGIGQAAVMGAPDLISRDAGMPYQPRPVNYVKRGLDVDDAATKAGLPPVKSGFTRLYRSESPTTKFNDVFDKSKLQDFNRNRPEGKSYTDDLGTADYYRMSYGRGAKTHYVDIPNSAARAAKIGDGEYVLNRNHVSEPTSGISQPNMKGIKK